MTGANQAVAAAGEKRGQQLFVCQLSCVIDGNNTLTEKTNQLTESSSSLAGIQPPRGSRFLFMAAARPLEQNDWTDETLDCDT